MKAVRTSLRALVLVSAFALPGLSLTAAGAAGSDPHEQVRLRILGTAPHAEPLFVGVSHRRSAAAQDPHRLARDHILSRTVAGPDLGLAGPSGASRLAALDPHERARRGILQ